jgi:hypothetical protein
MEGTMDQGTSDSDRKNNRTITVTYNADETFEFSCDTTTMRRKGDIVLQRDSDIALWTFVRVNKLKDPPFTWKRASDGSTITITNDHSVKDEYSFTVTILEGRTEHTSPDPIVTNPPMIRNL